MAVKATSSLKFSKILKKAVKREIASQGIEPHTRRGNRELTLLVNKFAQTPFSSLEEAERVGRDLGSQIAALSHEKGKKYLDSEIIRSLTPAAIAAPEADRQAKGEDKVAIDPKSPAQSAAAAPEKTDKNSLEPELTAEKAEVPAAEVPAAQATPEATSLKDRISQDIIRSMKAKDKIRLETVRSIKKVLIEKESQLRGEGRDTLTPDEEIGLLAQQAKQRRESIEQVRAGGREDLAEQEMQELAIIESYLPAQLTDEELEAIVDAAIAEVGATAIADLGKVMGKIVPQIKGRADGKIAQQLLRQKLS